MGGIAVVDSVDGAEVVWVAAWASGSLSWGGTVDVVAGCSVGNTGVEVVWGSDMALVRSDGGTVEVEAGGCG